MDKNSGYRGGSRIFFRRGCTRLLLQFNTNKPHSFFFCRIPVVLENLRSSRKEGGGAHPLHPPPRSAPGLILMWRRWSKLKIRVPLMVFHIIDAISFVLILPLTNASPSQWLTRQLFLILIHFFCFVFLNLNFFCSLILKESEYIRLSNSNKMREIKYFISDLKEENTNMQTT